MTKWMGLFLGVILFSFSAQAREASLNQLAGSYTGADQLGRACQVEIIKEPFSHSFVAVDYVGQRFEVNRVLNHNLQRDFQQDAQNPEMAYLNHYRYVGSSSFFGTYPETIQVLVNWHEGEVSSVSINVDQSSGPYSTRAGVMCFF